MCLAIKAVNVPLAAPCSSPKSHLCTYILKRHNFEGKKEDAVQTYSSL